QGSAPTARRSRQSPARPRPKSPSPRCGGSSARRAHWRMNGASGSGRAAPASGTSSRSSVQALTTTFHVRVKSYAPANFNYTITKAAASLKMARARARQEMKKPAVVRAGFFASSCDRRYILGFLVAGLAAAAGWPLADLAPFASAGFWSAAWFGFSTGGVIFTGVGLVLLASINCVRPASEPLLRYL